MEFKSALLAYLLIVVCFSVIAGVVSYVQNEKAGSSDLSQSSLDAAKLGASKTGDLAQGGVEASNIITGSAISPGIGTLDPSCLGNEKGYCEDGIDNDCDGLVDWEDEEDCFRVVPSSVCYVKYGDCTESDTPIMKMSASYNSHSEIFSRNNYGYTLCCKGSIKNTPEGDDSYDTVVKLSGVTNAHASDKTGTYPHEVLIASSKGEVDCQYTENDCETTFGEFYECIVTLSDKDNAHLSICNRQSSYDLKACCAIPCVDGEPDTSKGCCQTAGYKWLKEGETAAFGGYGDGEDFDKDCRVGDQTCIECCGDNIGEELLSMICGDVLLPGAMTPITDWECDADGSLVPPNMSGLIPPDNACCNNLSSPRCVMDGKCYEDDGRGPGDHTAEYTNGNGEELSCSLGHWCPVHFYYAEDADRCEYAGGEICYVDSEPESWQCQDYFFSEGWWADKSYEENPIWGYKDCFWEYLPPEPEESCCYMFQFQGVTYGGYGDIKVY